METLFERAAREEAPGKPPSALETNEGNPSPLQPGQLRGRAASNARVGFCIKYTIMIQQL